MEEEIAFLGTFKVICDFSECLSDLLILVDIEEMMRVGDSLFFNLFILMAFYFLFLLQS